MLAKSVRSPGILGINCASRVVNASLTSLHSYSTRSSPASNSSTAPANGKLVVGYVLHAMFTHNNTLLTLTSQYRRVGKLAEGLSDEQRLIDRVRPQQEVRLQVTTGTVGFRHTKQGEYEAGFQAAARMFQLMEEKGYLDHKLEIVFKLFGKGREAFEAALNGKEGNNIRGMVQRVTDNTTIKFGGVRAPRARRV